MLSQNVAIRTEFDNKVFETTHRALQYQNATIGLWLRFENADVFTIEALSVDDDTIGDVNYANTGARDDYLAVRPVGVKGDGGGGDVGADREQEKERGQKLLKWEE